VPDSNVVQIQKEEERALPDHTVILTYNPPAPGQTQPIFSANPPIVGVLPGQTIQFMKEGSLPGTIRLQFRHKELFSSPQPGFDADGIHDGEGVITVRPGVTVIPTTYHCQLRDPAGKVVAESHETGGAIEPASGMTAG
jgi:hypothetical protein